MRTAEYPGGSRRIRSIAQATLSFRFQFCGARTSKNTNYVMTTSGCMWRQRESARERDRERERDGCGGSSTDRYLIPASDKGFKPLHAVEFESACNLGPLVLLSFVISYTTVTESLFRKPARCLAKDRMCCKGTCGLEMLIASPSTPDFESQPSWSLKINLYHS